MQPSNLCQLLEPQSPSTYSSQQDNAYFHIHETHPGTLNLLIMISIVMLHLKRCDWKSLFFETYCWKRKNPSAASGLEPWTFQFAVQRFKPLGHQWPWIYTMQYDLENPKSGTDLHAWCGVSCSPEATNKLIYVFFWWCQADIAIVTWHAHPTWYIATWHTL